MCLARPSSAYLFLPIHSQPGGFYSLYSKDQQGDNMAVINSPKQLLPIGDHDIGPRESTLATLIASPQLGDTSIAGIRRQHVSQKQPPGTILEAHKPYH